MIKNKTIIKNGRKINHCSDKIKAADSKEYTLPASYQEETASRKLQWWKNGQLHQEDNIFVNKNNYKLPAMIETVGVGVVMTWVQNNKKHREDKDEFGLTLPAVEFCPCPSANSLIDDFVNNWWEPKNSTSNTYPLENLNVYNDKRVEEVELLFKKDFFGEMSKPVIDLNKKLRASWSWFKSGQAHREDKGKDGLTLPAYIDLEFEFDYTHEPTSQIIPNIQITKTYQWCKDGKIHRDTKEGSAEIIITQTLSFTIIKSEEKKTNYLNNINPDEYIQS